MVNEHICVNCFVKTDKVKIFISQLSLKWNFVNLFFFYKRRMLRNILIKLFSVLNKKFNNKIFK